MDSARQYLKQGQEIAERTNDFYGKLEALSLEGQIHQTEGKFRSARKAFLNALDMSAEARLYTNEKAYGYFLRYNVLKDSIFNVKKIYDIANLEFTYQVDKQARLDSLNQVQADLLRIEEEKQAKYLSDRKNTLEFSGITFFVLIIFLIIFEASLVAFDPLIDQWSKGAVAIKVLFNSGLAFAIFTEHHFLEGRMSRMIRRN